MIIKPFILGAFCALAAEFCAVFLAVFIIATVNVIREYRAENKR